MMIVTVPPARLRRVQGGSGRVRCPAHSHLHPHHRHHHPPLPPLEHQGGPGGAAASSVYCDNRWSGVREGGHLSSGPTAHGRSQGAWYMLTLKRWSRSLCCLGVFFIIPCVDVYEKIDMRTCTYEIPPQEVCTF